MSNEYYLCEIKFSSTSNFKIIINYQNNIENNDENIYKIIKSKNYIFSTLINTINNTKRVFYYKNKTEIIEIKSNDTTKFEEYIKKEYNPDVYSNEIFMSIKQELSTKFSIKINNKFNIFDDLQNNEDFNNLKNSMMDPNILIYIASQSKNYNKKDYIIDLTRLNKFKINNYDKNDSYLKYFHTEIIDKLTKIKMLLKYTIHVSGFKNIVQTYYTDFLKKIQSAVISIIKINNKGTTKYNKYRFDYSIKSDSELVIKYCDDNNKYEYNNQPDSKDLTTYKFGNFTKIFDFNQSNDNIVNHDLFSNIIENLFQNNESRYIFIIGYGASGSGKTSSLIKFHGIQDVKKPEDGVITKLCNLICKTKNEYNTIHLYIKEFFPNKNDKYHDIENDKFIFKYDKKSDNILLTEDKKFKIIHTYRLAEIEKFINLVNYINIEDNNTIEYKQNALFADILTILVDLDRFVKATTNNPQSSRSHTLIFVDFISNDNNNKKKTIIIGDFAGVENTFRCDDLNVINAFKNIKSFGSEELFYMNKKNVLNNRYDFIYDGKDNDGIACNDLSIFENNQLINNNIENFINNYILYNKQNKNEDEIIINQITNIISNISKRINNIVNINIDDLRKVISDSNTILEKNIFKKYSYDNRHYLTKIMGTKSTGSNQILVSNFIDKKNINNLTTEDFYLFYVLKYNSETYITDKGYKFEYKSINDMRVRLQNPDDLFYFFDIKNDNSLYKILLDIFKSINDLNSDLFSQFNRLCSQIIKDTEALEVYINDLKFLFKPHGKIYVLPINSTNYNTCITKMRTLYNLYIYALTSIKESYNIIQESSKNLNGNYYTNIIQLNAHNITQDSYTQNFNIIQNQVEQIIKQSINIETINMKIDFESYDFLIKYNNNAELSNTLKKIIENKISEIKYVHHSCKNRKEEGIYINAQLAYLRDSINYILYDKFPNFYNYITECFKQYIDIDHKKIQDNKDPTIIFKNVFFKSIYKHIYNTDQLTINNINELKKNIIICIFGVFNVSEMDNNPPPVPYINVNTYKKIILTKQITIDNFTKYISDIKSKLEYYNNSMYSVVINKIDDYLSYKYIPNIIINYKEILKYVIQLIDNLNSASVIGTLEYMDRVMKLNNTNILCEKSNKNI